MRLQLTIRKHNDAIVYYEGVAGRLKSEPTVMTRKMATDFKKGITKRLTKKYTEGQRHNTPTSLKRRLHAHKFTGGHKVFFDRIGDDHEKALPEIVEEGVQKNWPQPLNPIFRKRVGGHPPNQPKFFWRDALKEFESGIGQYGEKLMKRIVGR